MGKWHDSDDPGVIQRGIFRTGAFWLVAVLVLGGIIGAIIWAIGVGTSDIAGRGDAIRTRNAASNRIAAQERFEEMYAEIQSSDRRVVVAYEAWQDDRSDSTAKQNYYGVRNYCQSLVGDYNAESRKFTAEQFRAADLPYQIDQTDPSTDCEKDQT